MPALLCFLVIAFGQVDPHKTLAQCLTRDFASYESVLRARPERQLSVNGEDRIYQTSKIGVVTLHKRPKSSMVNGVTMTMPLKSKKTWRQILTDFGISPDGAVTKKMDRGRYAITPHTALPAGWAIEWNPGQEGGGYDRLIVWQPIRIVYG